jgi:3-isopropylmalate/(R)-2-methylmalate dehydratase small subunit
MEGSRITRVVGKAVSIPGGDIDTDRIIPARFLMCVTFDGLRNRAFEDDRQAARLRGETHPLDDPAFTRARILLVNKNFGCGSSREHAPQALRRWNQGIRAIVGESFAEIFFGNCTTLGIPCLTADERSLRALMQANRRDPEAELGLDLQSMQARLGPHTVSLSMPEGTRQQLLEGRWDPTLELLEAREQIEAWAASLPYFDGWK